MASGLCAALTGRTHGCTDQPASVKKTLANSEPSTHGHKADLQRILLFVWFRSEADMHSGVASAASVAIDPERTFSLARASLKQRLRGGGVQGSEDSIGQSCTDAPSVSVL